MDATLTAALVAAGVSIATFVAGWFATSGAAKRAAHRALLVPHLSDLGAAIHDCVASSKTLAARIEQGQSRDSWAARAKDAAPRLNDVRRKVKYPLWGLEEAFRTIARVPGWVPHAAATNPDRAARLLEAAEALRVGVDAIIREAFRSGTLPNVSGLPPLIMAVNAVFDEGAPPSLRGRFAEADTEATND